MWALTDTSGLCLINPESMKHVWEVQQKHLPCIQDPPDLVLNYTPNLALGYKRETRSWMYSDVAEGRPLWKAFIATSAPLSRVSRNSIVIEI